MNKQDNEQVQILPFNGNHDLRLNNLEECRCWSKKFHSFNSNNTSNRTSRTSIDQSDKTSDESNLKMNQISQSDQYSSLNHYQVNRQSTVIDLQFDDYEQFYIPIEGYEILDKRTKFVVYKLKVECISSGLFWFIYRRYTDFERLNDKLRSRYKKLDFLSLPNKGGFFENVFNPIFLEKRQLSLQLYLNRLMSCKLLLKDPLIKKFLCLDEPPITFLSSETLTYPSSICSENGDQLFSCSNCFLLEKKLDEMQLIIESKDAKIKQLETALKVKNTN